MISCRLLLSALLLSTVCLLVTACSNKIDKAYINKASSVRPMKIMKGVDVKTGEDYFAVPRTAVPTDVKDYQPPSIVPPGSNLQRFEK